MRAGKRATVGRKREYALAERPIFRCLDKKVLGNEKIKITAAQTERVSPPAPHRIDQRGWRAGAPGQGVALVAEGGITRPSGSSTCATSRLHPTAREYALFSQNFLFSRQPKSWCHWSENKTKMAASRFLSFVVCREKYDHQATGIRIHSRDLLS